MIRFLAFIFLTVMCCCQPGQITGDIVYNKDIDGKVYSKQVMQNGKTKLYYVDINGNETAVCARPHKEARVFNGSESRLNEFIEKKLVYPAISAEGKVYIVLLIDKWGKVKDKRAVRSIAGCDACTQNALNLVDGLQEWEPAYYNNKRQPSLKHLIVPYK